MNKQDLINSIVDELGHPKRIVEDVVNETFNHIDDALAAGSDVKISGFGTFKRAATKARACRNPQTGGVVEVPAGHKVKFEASSKLKVAP